MQKNVRWNDEQAGMMSTSHPGLVDFEKFFIAMSALFTKRSSFSLMV